MPQFQDGHAIQLLQGSKAYFAALARAMDQAAFEIRFESYMFDFTDAAQSVAESLMRAAYRGVSVFLLVDGVGTGPIPAEWQKRLTASGVQWHVYNPLGRLGLLIPSRWRRLHRKLCAIDGGTDRAIGFCGGINVLDDYHDPNHGKLSKPRFDFSIQVCGPLVQDIVVATTSLWHRQRIFRQIRKHPFQSVANGWANARRMVARVDQTRTSDTSTGLTGAGGLRAALLLRDNVRNRKRIEKAYLKAIGGARQEIIIANAYFLPGGKLRAALLNAAKRGVKVTLLLQGRYEYFMQYHAARPVYEVLLKNGIEIHEYAASFLHAKVAVIDADSDRAWSTVGSSNLDPLSLLLAREANVVVLDSAFAFELRARLTQAMTDDGKHVNLEEFVNRPWHQRILDRIAFGLMRLALSITGRRY